MVLILLVCLISIQSIVYGKKHLLGSNEKERTTKCAEEVCDFLCLATKCGNEHIAIEEEKYEDDWVGVINVHCTESFSCMGRVTIDGTFRKSWFKSPHRIELSKLYCNNAAKHSCQGAQFIFIDTNNQYLIGDVRESDILFKNANSANIVVVDDVPVTEQFFLNEVFTRNIMEMNIIALAPFSMVGSIFDLTGVYQRISIQCKGEGSCSGSLFIFNRCMITPYYATKIMCGINACNGISIWIINEDDDCKKLHPDSKAHHFRETVELIPFVSDHELNAEETETFAKRWIEQKQKDVFVMVEKGDSKRKSFKTKQWSVLKKDHGRNSYHLKEDTGFWKELCHKQRGSQRACRILVFGDAFKVRRTETKNEWLEDITQHLQDLSKNLKDETKETRHNEWVRKPSSAEYYGGLMIEGMMNKMAVGVALGFTAAVGTIIAGHSLLTAAGLIINPLVIPGIVLVGAAFFLNSLRKKNKGRLQFPESKVHFEVDEEPINGEKNAAAHEAAYNEWMEQEMEGANWIEVDGNGKMLQYDLLTGNKHYSEEVLPMHVNDNGVDYTANYSEYTVVMFIGVTVAAVVCCCALCFGGVFGFVFGNAYSRKERNVEDI
eukprot:445335_1